jgi:hypothetical protein
MKSELASFESSKKEYWTHSCFIYSCLENSFKGNHAAMEYYLMLHQKNLDAGITEFFEASQLLDDICAHFKDTSEVTKTKLTLKFSSFRVKEGETVEVYATRFERLVQSLGLVNVKNDDVVLQEFIFVQTLLTMTTYATFDLMKTAQQQLLFESKRTLTRRCDVEIENLQKSLFYVDSQISFFTRLK